MVAYPDDSCREMAERFALSTERSLPVVSPQDPIRLLGILGVTDLLKARQWAREEEGKREQFFGRPRRADGGIDGERLSQN